MTVSAADARSNAAMARGDQDAEQDRHDRRRQERQPGRAQDQGPERQPRLDRACRARADSASKYRRDRGTDRSEYSKNGTSDSSQPHAERPIRSGPASSSRADARRHAAPHRHVAALVVAVARLRPDVRAGQRHLPVGRHGQTGRGREGRCAAARIDRGLDRDATSGSRCRRPRRRCGTDRWRASRARCARRSPVSSASRRLLVDHRHDRRRPMRRRPASRGRAGA